MLRGMPWLPQATWKSQLPAGTLQGPMFPNTSQKPGLGGLGFDISSSCTLDRQHWAALTGAVAAWGQQ